MRLLFLIWCTAIVQFIEISKLSLISTKRKENRSTCTSNYAASIKYISLYQNRHGDIKILRNGTQSVDLQLCVSITPESDDRYSFVNLLTKVNTVLYTRRKENRDMQLYTGYRSRHVLGCTCRIYSVKGRDILKGCFVYITSIDSWFEIRWHRNHNIRIIHLSKYHRNRNLCESRVEQLIQYRCISVC